MGMPHMTTATENLGLAPITDLREITSADQFESYYAQKGLKEYGEKIQHLKDAMKIKATRYEYDVTEKEMLTGLEESVLYGYWKVIPE